MFIALRNRYVDEFEIVLCIPAMRARARIIAPDCESNAPVQPAKCLTFLDTVVHLAREIRYKLIQLYCTLMIQKECSMGGVIQRDGSTVSPDEIVSGDPSFRHSAQASQSIGGDPSIRHQVERESGVATGQLIGGD